MTEKLCKSHTGAKARRWLKRQLARMRRRLWKRKGEDAPVKTRHLTKGWSD